MKLIAVRAFTRRVRPGVWLAGLVWLSASQGIEAGTNVWTTSGPEGSSISCLAIDPLSSTTLYAVGGGLFKSTDRGRSWDFIGPDGACPLVIDPLTPTTLYYPTSSGVAKSTDGGSTWRSLEIAPGLRLMGVTALAIDPQTPTTLYAGAWSKPYVDRQGEGVFKTTDGGETWARAGDLGRFNSPSGFINSLVIEPRTPTMVHAATNLGVCNSSDGGATWGCSASGLAYYAINSLRIDPQTQSTIYANSSYEVQISMDGGHHWSELNTDASGAGVYILAIDPKTPTILYGGIYAAGVVKSTDAGATWSSLNAGLTDLRVTDLVIDPANPAILHAGTRSGVFTLEQVSNRSPAADAGPDLVVEATGPDGALVTLDGSGSSDADGDALAFDWSSLAGRASGLRPTVEFPMGTTTVTLTVSDPQGATATDTVQISVRDTTPPALQAALTRIDNVGGSEGTFLVGYGATDLCSSPSVTAVMWMPAGAEALRVVYARDGGGPGLSRVIVDFGKGVITLEGGDEATLRDLLARMVAAGGARVAQGQEVRLRLETERKQRYTFTFSGGVLVEERAPAIRLRATAYDAAGNSSTTSAVPVFGGVRPRGGGARR